MGKRTNTATWSDKYSRWQINVQRDGKRRSFYSSAPGRTGQREANAKADAWLDDGIEAGGARVSALYAEFIASKKESTGQSHWRGVESRYKNHISPALGHKRIDRVTEQDLQDVINKAYAQHGLAAKTLLNLRGDLSAFFKFCRRRKVSTLIPEDLTIPASAKRPNKGILQPADLLKLFNSDNTERRGKSVREEFVNAFRLEVLTGMRPGEIIGLQWEDIHGRAVHLQRSINKYGETTQGKNRNAVRTVELPEMAAAVLDAQREITGGAGSVFCISSAQTYRKHWERYRIANGISKATPYELRHTFVSVAKVLPEGQVKAVVGHRLMVLALWCGGLILLGWLWMYNVAGIVDAAGRAAPYIGAALANLYRFGAVAAVLAGIWGLAKARVDDRRWAAVYILALAAVLLCVEPRIVLNTLSDPDVLFAGFLRRYAAILLGGLVGAGIALC